jgi:GTP-binding protein
MFIDEMKIFARAGHGGKGCVAFHREAYITKGGPSGGNGGRGGSVILQADHDLNNLIAQYYKPRLIAQKGEAGLGKGMDGRAGKDLLVKVPCGTLVWKLPSPVGPSEEVATETEESE